MSKESSVSGEVLSSAKSRLDEGEITLPDDQEILAALSELPPSTRTSGRTSCSGTTTGSRSDG